MLSSDEVSGIAEKISDHLRDFQHMKLVSILEDQAKLANALQAELDTANHAKLLLQAKTYELSAERDALQAENERLREALSEIDELTCGIDVSLGSLIDRVWTISSRALAKPTGGTE